MSEVSTPLPPIGMGGQASLSPAAVPTRKGCIRPFKLTTLVRTRFEEAAFRYAAEVRRAACFPPGTTAVITTDTTPVIATLATPRITTRRGPREVPTQPVRPTVHVPEAALPSPLPDAWTNCRSWDEGDTIVRGIQEMRSQFADMSGTIYSRPPQPPPSSRLPPPHLPDSPPAQRRTRPVRLLFGRGGGRSRGVDVQAQDDEDEYIDIEEVSPPRTTYHLYRLSADGTSCTLPLSVTPSNSTSLHLAHSTLDRNNLPQTQGGSAALPPQNYALVTLPQQHRPPLVGAALLEKDRITNSHYMAPQMAPSRPSQRPDDSGVAPRCTPASRYHREALKFTVPHKTKGNNPERTSTSSELGEDDDVLVVSENKVNLIEISSDSSPEMDGGTKTLRARDKESSSPPSSVTSSPIEVNKNNVMSSRADARANKIVSSEDDSLPDLTRMPPLAGHHSGGGSKMEDNLSDISTIIFEDINLDEWTEDELEEFTTNTSKGGDGEATLPSTCHTAAHDQSGDTVTLVVDKLEVVSLPCTEQNTNSAGGNNQNDDDTSHQVPEESRPDNSFTKTEVMTSQQNNHEGIKHKEPVDKEVTTEKEEEEAAVPLTNAHDETTDASKEGLTAVARSESLLTEGKEEDKITAEAKVKCVGTESEVGVLVPVPDEVAKEQNTEEDAVPRETDAAPFVVAPSTISIPSIVQLDDAEGKMQERRDLVTSADQCSTVAGGEENCLDKYTSNEDTETIKTCAKEKNTDVIITSEDLEKHVENEKAKELVASTEEVKDARHLQNPKEHEKVLEELVESTEEVTHVIATSKDLEKHEENEKALEEPVAPTEDVTNAIPTSKDLEKHTEKDKGLQETVIHVDASQHLERPRSKTKVRRKKQKRRSQRPKRVQRPRALRGRGVSWNDFCEVVDPSCTLFVSDGQQVVAIQVPRTLRQDGESDAPRERCDGTETHSQQSPIYLTAPPGTPLHILPCCPPHPTTATQKEQNSEVEALLQQSPTRMSAPHGSPRRFLSAPRLTAAVPEEKGKPREPSEGDAFESRSGNTKVHETEHVEPAEQGESSMKGKDADITCGESPEESKGSEAMGEKMISTKEMKVSHSSELLKGGSMIPKMSETRESRGVTTDDMGNSAVSQIPPLCQDETSGEVVQGEGKTGANIQREPVVEEVRPSPETVPEIDTKGASELVLEAEERKTSLQQVPATEESRITHEQVSKVEERGEFPESVPQGEKILIPEQKPDIEPKDTDKSHEPEEKRRVISNQEVKTQEKRRDNTEVAKGRGVIPSPEAETEEKRRDTAAAPVVEKRREVSVHQEAGTEGIRDIAGILGIKEIRGSEKGAIGSPGFSSERSESESGGVGQGKPAILRRSNSSSSNCSSSSSSSGISRLADRLLELRLRGHPLKQPQAWSNAIPSVSSNTASPHGAGKPSSSPLEPYSSLLALVSSGHQKHKDTMRALMEELRLMGNRMLAAIREEEQGSVHLPVSESDGPRGCHHHGRRETGIEGNVKEENSGLTIIQCVAEVHHSADADIDVLKHQRYKTRHGRPQNYVGSEHCERKCDKASNTVSANEANGTDDRAFITDSQPMREGGTELKPKRRAPGKDTVPETIMEVYDGGIPVEVVGGGEVEGKNVDVPPIESTRNFIQREEYSEESGFRRENEESLASTGAFERPHLRGTDGLTTHKTEHREQPTQGSRKRDELEKSTLTPSQSDIKIMNNDSPTQPPQPSPLPSVGDFFRKESRRIHQPHSKPSHARPHRKDTHDPRVFGDTLQDFVESTHCAEDPQERKDPTYPPTSSNHGFGSDSIQHSVGGWVKSPSTYTIGAHSSINGYMSSVSGSQPAGNLTQPVVGAAHPFSSGVEGNGAQTLTDGTQPYVQYIQSEKSTIETQPSHTTQPSVRGSQTSSEGSLPIASQSQPSSLAAKERNKRWSEESADEESDVDGMPRERKRRRKGRGSLYRVVEVPLTDKLSECLRVAAAAGEALLAPLRIHGVMGPSHRFTSLQPDHTRSLLNQMIRNRRGRSHTSGEDNTNYKNLLALHGLIKVAGLLRHCGLRPALHCLDQYHRTHHGLLEGCYSSVMARLEAVLERKGEGAVHPKVTILRQEMQRARQREDPGDTEFKVLVAARREAQWVCCQLQEEFGSGTVALLPRMPEYDHVLHLLERRSILVWEEGEALHQLPCSQFSLVVEWEGSSSSSVCVDHCTRQNIHVVSFMSSSSTSEQETVSREGNRDQHELKGNTIITSGNESQGGTGSSRGQGQRDILTVVASDCVTANTELHYILTSMFDINLVERNARNIMLEEGSQGWADLLLDERTCVLLQPLATLRSDAHLNELTCHLVLLSLQCTTCYIIMYSQQSSNSGCVGLVRKGKGGSHVSLYSPKIFMNSDDYD
ncbi:uncharacterized protein LOC126981572 [Eriocheir sinensis]|uniref:uncharacterized protein LOC126981572 n=1 Tax=Eriocheir sinensis TaxID=95602 RepID=UPI0021C9BA8E|nr:uncharacterized protein LOC126981572 [Eriocheir sinensis]